MLEILEQPYKVELKVYTIREVFEALKKNGFEHLRDEFFSAGYSGACVLGQAALNLGVVAIPQFYEENVDIDLDLGNGDTEKWDRYNLVNQLNRYKAKSWVESRKVGDDWVAGPSELGCGSVIITWNDAGYVDEKAEHQWYLKTYAEVVAMAAEVLKPYMSKTVRLATYEYGN